MATPTATTMRLTLLAATLCCTAALHIHAPVRAPRRALRAVRMAEDDDDDRIGAGCKGGHAVGELSLIHI